MVAVVVHREAAVVAVAVVVLFALAAIDMAHCGPYPCTPCREEECERLVEFCPYGESRDQCNRRVCAKGPGGRCGGPNNIFGDCGEGLRCKTDERCHGCYLATVECW